MSRFREVATFAIVCLTFVCLPLAARASLLTNGDFHQGDHGWVTTGTATCPDFQGMPAEHLQHWNLSPWQTVMDGNFMLLEGGQSGFSTHLALPVPLSASNPLSFSMDYAIAWDFLASQTAYDYGYWSLELTGRNMADGRYHPLGLPAAKREVSWGPYQGMTRRVVTGSISMTDVGPLVDGLYDELNLSLLLFNPNQTLFQIAGFDNFSLTMDTATPVPEPSTLALSGLGLAGALWWRGRKRSPHPRVSVSH